MKKVLFIALILLELAVSSQGLSGKGQRFSLGSFPDTEESSLETFPKVKQSSLDTFPKEEEDDVDEFPKGEEAPLDTFPKGGRGTFDTFPKGGQGSLDTFPKGGQGSLDTFPKGGQGALDSFPKGGQGALDSLSKAQQRSLESFLNAPPGLFPSADDTSNPISKIIQSSKFLGAAGQLASIVSNPQALNALFKNFKNIFKKSYPISEEPMRIFNMQDAMTNIVEHNVKAFSGDVNYERGINKFADMTEEELIAQYTGYISKNTNATLLDLQAPPPSVSLPDGGRRKRQVPNSFDWRNYGAVSPVKNQEDCGACVLFAATGCLESAWFLKHGGREPMLDLSEQELMDCIPISDGHQGCGGNDYAATMPYQITQGQGYDRQYRYKQKVGTCRRQDPVAQADRFYMIEPENEEALKFAVANYGPVGVAIHMSDDLGAYYSGIFEGDCKGDRNHAVIVAGYGREGGKDFWLIKNSWGDDWGDNGYFKLRRNFGNVCQVASDCYFFIA